MSEDDLMQLDDIAGYDGFEQFEENLPKGAGLLTQRVLDTANFEHVFFFQDCAGRENSVVLVSRTAVYVKEVLQDGSLRTVSVKKDFHSQICAACMLDATSVNTEHNSGSQRAPTLVVTLESKELIFLRIENHAENGVVFSSHCVPLPMPVPPLCELGQYVAADPNARAVATAAVKDSIIIYATSPAQQQPVYMSLPLRTELVICTLAFLYPPTEDNECVSLLVVGTKQGRAHLIVYSWNASEPLQFDTIQQSSQRLGREHGMPVFVAALKLSGVFLLVCERTMALYQYGHDGFIQQQHSEGLHNNSAHALVSGRPFMSCRMPLWTTWTRSLLNHSADSDAVYIFREDGLVRGLCFGRRQGMLELRADHVLACLNTNIDRTLTAVLPTSRGLERLLVTGSAGINIYELPTPQRDYINNPQIPAVDILDTVYSIRNWTHATALAVVEGENSPSIEQTGLVPIGGSTPSERSRLFMTSISFPEGTVSEIRYGLQLRLTPLAAYPDLTGVDGIWSLPLHDGSLCFLCSFPWQTILLHEARGSVAQFDITMENTLVARTLTESPDEGHTIIVYVTKGMLQLLQIRIGEDDSPLLQVLGSSPLETASTAALTASADTLVCTTRAAGSFVLQRWSIISHERDPSVIKPESAFPLTYEPSSTALFRIDASAVEGGHESMNIERKSSAPLSPSDFVAIGTTSGNIHVVRVGGEHDFAEVSVFRFARSVPCESLAILSTISAQATSLSTVTLLGGFRDGTVRFLRFQECATGCSTMLEEVFSSSFGTLPAKIFTWPESENVVVVSSGSTLCYVELSDGPVDQPTIKQIFIGENEGSPDRTSHADTADTVLYCPSPWGFVCMKEGKLCMGTLNLETAMMPAIQSVPGTPKRLLHSHYLNTLIVCATTTDTSWQTGLRFPLSAIFFLEASNTDVKSQETRVPAFVCAPGERINDITEWFCKRGNRTYHFLIATLEVSTDEDLPFGQLKYFKATRHRDGKLTVTIAHESRENEPVYAIVQKGDDSLVYGSGVDLKLRRFQPNEGRFHRPHTFRLGSPAVSITVNEPYLFVTTASNSLLVLKHDPFESEVFRLVFSDNQARSGITHLPVLGSRGMLLSDRDRLVVHLQWSQDHAGSFESFSLLATHEAKLPSSIVKLVKASVRPPWKHAPIGVLERDILGLATDGAIYTIGFLTKPAWLLLSFVQMMCMTDSTIYPLSRSNTINSQHLRAADSPNHHIDGDILNRLLRRPDAAERLGRMLNATDLPQETATILRQLVPDKRRQLCERLLNNVMQDAVALSSDKQEEHRRMIRRAGDLVEDLLRLLRAMLEMPF